ncbi:MAG: hypothetical protein IT162_18795 [Bryobacterales bacterium]|nr:hypothetical protein [Bryobacterales bacterium]
MTPLFPTLDSPAPAPRDAPAKAARRSSAGQLLAHVGRRSWRQTRNVDPAPGCPLLARVGRIVSQPWGGGGVH